MNKKPLEVPYPERQEIAQFLGAHWGMDLPEEIADIRESMNAVCIRNYMSDGPGYHGPIYFVVFGGGPEFHLTIIRAPGGKLEIVESEWSRHILSPPPPTREIHDPGCTGDPERCDCIDYKPCSKCGARLPEEHLPGDDTEICERCAGSEITHEKDTDCEPYMIEETNCCAVCGADHSQHCYECGGKAYHLEGCSMYGALFEEDK